VIVIAIDDNECDDDYKVLGDYNDNGNAGEDSYQPGTKMTLGG